MTYKTEFPDFADMPADIPAEWRDSSWHNDTCPSFEFFTAGNGDSNYRRAIVWIAESNPAEREPANSARFLVSYYEGETDCFDAMTSDNWQEILDYVETRASLAARYVSAVGYNPFLDCPDIAPETVAETLKELQA